MIGMSNDFSTMTQEEFTNFMKDDLIPAWEQQQPFEYPSDMSLSEYSTEMYQRWKLMLEANPRVMRQGPYILHETIHFRLDEERKSVSRREERNARAELDKKTEMIDRLIMDSLPRVERYLERKRKQDGKFYFSSIEKKLIIIIIAVSAIIALLYIMAPMVFSNISHSHFGMLGDTLTIVAVIINAYALILLSASLRDDADHEHSILIMQWLDSKQK